MPLSNKIAIIVGGAVPFSLSIAMLILAPSSGVTILAVGLGFAGFAVLLLGAHELGRK